jgi:hypothetical protein
MIGVQLVAFFDTYAVGQPLITQAKAVPAKGISWSGAVIIIKTIYLSYTLVYASYCLL